MAANDTEQKSELVPQHKRLAMGEKLDGTSLKPKGQSQDNKPRSGLSHVKSKK
jgi:hypothetical protein